MTALSFTFNSMMKFQVQPIAREQLKIFYSIILNIPVNMMNYFFRSKVSSKMIFHNKPGSFNVPSAISMRVIFRRNINIARIIFIKTLEFVIFATSYCRHFLAKPISRSIVSYFLFMTFRKFSAFKWGWLAFGCFRNFSFSFCGKPKAFSCFTHFIFRCLRMVESFVAHITYSSISYSKSQGGLL